MLQEVLVATTCADEGTDTANQEQLPPIINFVHTIDLVHREFMNFMLAHQLRQTVRIVLDVKRTRI